MSSAFILQAPDHPLSFSDTFSKELGVDLVTCISAQGPTSPLLTSHTCQI